MHVIDPTAAYSILGTSIHLDRVDGGTLMLRAPLRLCPGRTISIRSGATTFRAMVVNARVHALHGEQGASYEIQAQMAESTSSSASPAELEALKKGGNWRAA
jgi:hypothetical protein